MGAPPAVGFALIFTVFPQPLSPLPIAPRPSNRKVVATVLWARTRSDFETPTDWALSRHGSPPMVTVGASAPTSSFDNTISAVAGLWINTSTSVDVRASLARAATSSIFTVLSAADAVPNSLRRDSRAHPAATHPAATHPAATERMISLAATLLAPIVGLPWPGNGLVIDARPTGIERRQIHSRPLCDVDIVEHVAVIEGK